MRTSLLLLLFAAACGGRTPPTDDTTAGDDDDDVVGDDDDDTTAGCETVDADEDGTNACDDCDDTDPAIHPGAPERCNEEDDDCDGAPLPDEGPDCMACDASGYWLTTRGLTGDALLAELHALSTDHFCRNYSEATTFMFVELDKVNGEVECVYTGRKTPVGNDKPSGTDMNTEHTWPQSQGADTFPAECDLNHLYPTDANANSTRGNFPFGVVVSGEDWSVGGSKRGRDATGQTVFEPRDVHKGNVARSMLYFGMQYEFVLDPAYLQLFKDWHALDPVDDVEVERTLGIEAQQGGGNAFVLCPWLVDEL